MFYTKKWHCEIKNNQNANNSLILISMVNERIKNNGLNELIELLVVSGGDFIQITRIQMQIALFILAHLLFILCSP